MTVLSIMVVLIASMAVAVASALFLLKGLLRAIRAGNSTAMRARTER
ncbi:MAG: hypothetical protein LC114_08995 [Bryobacterales bacterium]|nr:hypothetical protein [Bryobacterales bacterium]